ncbi:MAG TPA: hypothetical protein VIO11_03245 [Candidatus Methanoperedens sp.]
MALEELMLVNPKGKYPRRKSLQIVFPKPHMKVNPSAIDRVKEAGKGLMGDVTFKEVAGGVGGVASTVLIPQYLKLKGWKDVAGSGAVAVGGGLLVRQADKGAGNAFILTGMAFTALKGVREIVTYAKGKTSKTRRTNTSGKLSAIDDPGKEFDEILGLGQDEIDSDLLGDMGSLLNGGIADLGEEIVET